MNALISILAIIVGLGAPLAWITAIVLAVIMLRRGGGKAERIWLIGSALMFANIVLSYFVSFTQQSLINWAQGTGLTVGTVMQLVLFANKLITVVGTVLLVYAFWIKFKVTAHA